MRFLTAVLLASVAAGDLPELAFSPAPGEDFSGQNCSLYCAIDPHVTVSTHLSRQGRVRYGAEQLQDGRSETAWIVQGGPGEWFELTFRPSAQQVADRRLGVNSLSLLNGYQKSRGHWADHSRAKRLRLVVNGEPRAVLSLPDDPTAQSVRLPDLPIGRGLVMRCVVLEVYPGRRFAELAISEVQVDGYGHH